MQAVCVSSFVARCRWTNHQLFWHIAYLLIGQGWAKQHQSATQCPGPSSHVARSFLEPLTSECQSMSVFSHQCLLPKEEEKSTVSAPSYEQWIRWEGISLTCNSCEGYHGSLLVKLRNKWSSTKLWASIFIVCITTLEHPTGARPPGQIFFIFMQYLKKIDQNNRLALPPLRLAPPPLGNPGSATAPYKLYPVTWTDKFRLNLHEFLLFGSN